MAEPHLSSHGTSLRRGQVRFQAAVQHGHLCDGRSCLNLYHRTRLYPGMETEIHAISRLPALRRVRFLPGHVHLLHLDGAQDLHDRPGEQRPAAAPANSDGGCGLVYTGHLRVPDVVLAGVVAGQAVSSGIVQKADQRPSNHILTDLVGSTHLLFARKSITHESEAAPVQVLLISLNSHFVAA